MSSLGRRTLQGLFICTASAAWLAGAGVAHSGPCTAQIAQFVNEINSTPPGPTTGPTFSQTLGAQLHHQPTPRDVEHAEHVASKEVNAALNAARKADAAGDADGCNAALGKARHLYEIGQ